MQSGGSWERLEDDFLATVARAVVSITSGNIVVVEIGMFLEDVLVVAGGILEDGDETHIIWVRGPSFLRANVVYQAFRGVVPSFGVANGDGISL
jgi:hypothetical protein